MIDYVVYGKIHLDLIRQISGERIFLGGGGPQAAFGVRIWSDRVGFMTRSGADLPPRFVQQLEAMGIDLAGWTRFDKLPTPMVELEYDERQYLLSAGLRDRDAWRRMMRTDIPLPDAYRSPKAIHLVTEWADERMVHDALAMRQQGAVFSLEPLLDYTGWTNRDGILALLEDVDVVTPDWPSASGIAGSEAPREVLARWTQYGARMVAIRHGAHGAYVWSQGEDRLWHLPGVPIDNVVDPTGAGNAFGGGLAVGWTETGDARTAGSYGAISAYSLLGAAGIPPITRALRERARGLVWQTIESAKEL